MNHLNFLYKFNSKYFFLREENIYEINFFLKNKILELNEGLSNVLIFDRNETISKNYIYDDNKLRHTFCINDFNIIYSYGDKKHHRMNIDIDFSRDLLSLRVFPHIKQEDSYLHTTIKIKELESFNTDTLMQSILECPNVYHRTVFEEVIKELKC